MKPGVVSKTQPRAVPEERPRRAPLEPGEDRLLPVVITFDLDAEVYLLAQDPSNLARAALLSAARYGIRRGLQRVLRVLAQEDVRATFFVPGWVIDNEREACKAIAEEGHEIAHHGYTHLSPLSCTRDEEREELQRGIDAIVGLTGQRPVGYRAPFRDVSPHTVELLAEFEFLYSSNMQDDDAPYRYPGFPQLVELPVNPVLDDASYFLYRPPQQRHFLSHEHVLGIWQAELLALLREPGSIAVLTLHPELIGRASRCEMLRLFIRFAREQDRVRFLTAREAAELVLKGQV